MSAILDVLSGEKKIRDNLSLFDKLLLFFAVGSVVVIFGTVFFLLGSITYHMSENASPTPYFWEIHAELQRPLVKEFMKCSEPIAEGTQGIVRQTTKVQWSCTGNCGIYDMHYYQTLSNGWETVICSGDFVSPSQSFSSVGVIEK